MAQDRPAMPPPRMATLSGSCCDVLVAVMDVMQRTAVYRGCFSWNDLTCRVERRMVMQDVNTIFISIDVYCLCCFIATFD